MRESKIAIKKCKIAIYCYKAENKVSMMNEGMIKRGFLFVLIIDNYSWIILLI